MCLFVCVGMYLCGYVFVCACCVYVCVEDLINLI